MSYVVSWSGGKDSCLALERAVRAWGLPAYLLSMLCEDGLHSRSHGLPPHLLQAQAESLGVPLRSGAATWDDYEGVFIEILRTLHEEGVQVGVFGDIDLDEHREWEHRVCEAAGMIAHLPLWREDHSQLMTEFLAAGFRASIVTVRLNAVPEDYLGEEITPALVGRLMELGVDVCGEGGEFHTFVWDGPLFRAPVAHRICGVVRMEGYAQLDLV